MRDDLAALGAALADEYGHGPMNERQQIEGLVQWGRISPQDAEDWLKAQDPKKREPPMAEEPDPSRFDPAAEPFWTLGMATAWVLWGTDDAVRSEWADFITRRWSWRPYDEMEAHEKAPGGKVRVKGHKLHQGEPKGAWGVVAFAGVNPNGLRTTPEDAKRKILSALQREGDLPAVQGDDEHVREVPAMAWVGLSPFSPGRREQHDAVFARGVPRDPKLHHVKVRSADVLRLWPALDDWAPDGAKGEVEEPPAAAEVPVDVDFVPVAEETPAPEVPALVGPVVDMKADEDGAADEVLADQNERNRAQTARGRQTRADNQTKRRAWVRDYMEEHGENVEPTLVMTAYLASPGAKSVGLSSIKADLAALRRTEAKKS